MNNFKNTESKKSRKNNLVLAFIVVIIVFFILGILSSTFIITPFVEDKIFHKNAESETKEQLIEKNNETSKQNETDVINQNPDEKSIIDYTNPVVDIVNNIGPAVVSIQSDATTLFDMTNDSSTSFGSGFIISEDGYIVTNNHVIENGKRFTVIMSDGTEYYAEFVGGDAYRDIAVLKIEADNITTIPIGDSDKVQVGELAIAIGNPLGQGLGGTVTVGYISAVQRLVEGSEYLQTDAAINPGNSGGPLVNINGEVIGINALKNYLAGIDEYGIPIATEGIGFAIPINDAISVANELIATGQVKRPGIGITIIGVTEDLSVQENVPVGAYIADIVRGGPADIAGMEFEDIIIGINGQTLDDPSQLPKIVEKLEIGSEAVFSVWRNGKTLDITVIIGNLNEMN